MSFCLVGSEMCIRDRFQCSRLLHECALVSKYVMKKFDTTHASVWSNSAVKTVDLSKHRLFQYFQMMLFSSSHGFCNTNPLVEEHCAQYLLMRSISHCDLRCFFSLFWHPCSVLCFALRFVTGHPCFITSDDFMETLWVTIVIEWEDIF